jgi:tetratricopeptide (TPR) repeat protein
MKREHRKQIKRDELVTGMERAATWTRAHGREVRATLIGVAVVVLGALGFTTYQERRGAAAERAFAEAFDTFHASVATELPPEADRPAGPVFATAEEKYKKAAAAFDGVERRYGSLPAGRRARYYAALCRIEMGQHAEAEKALDQLVAETDRSSLESGLARLALADLYRRLGQTDKAVAAYRQLADDTSLAVPRDHVLMSLGGTLEDARRAKEARASYRRLTEEFPTSIFLSEARRRADDLATAAG